LTLDVEQRDFNTIIMDMIIPIVRREKPRFDKYLIEGS